MARIAVGVIERIKSEVSLVRLTETQGYALVKLGGLRGRRRRLGRCQC